MQFFNLPRIRAVSSVIGGGDFEDKKNLNSNQKLNILS